MKNAALISHLNSSTVALSEGLRQEDQSETLQMILLLHNWSMEDPEKTFMSSEGQNFPERNID